MLQVTEETFNNEKKNLAIKWYYNSPQDMDILDLINPFVLSINTDGSLPPSLKKSYHYRSMFSVNSYLYPKVINKIPEYLLDDKRITKHKKISVLYLLDKSIQDQIFDNDDPCRFLNNICFSDVNKLNKVLSLNDFVLFELVKRKKCSEDEELYIINKLFHKGIFSDVVETLLKLNDPKHDDEWIYQLPTKYKQELLVARL